MTGATITFSAILQSLRRASPASILWAVVTAAVLRLWVNPLHCSFWLDETITVCVIRDGFWQVFSRAFHSPFQSVLFGVVEWLTRHATGLNEISLRLPSFLAALGALYVYYRIGVEFIDRAAGLIAVALYVGLVQVVIEVPNARPYSLALFAEAAALLWLLRWLRSGRLREGIYWALCAALSTQLHYVFVMVAPLEICFAAWRILRGSSATWRQLLICCLVFAAVLAPLIPQMLLISRQATILSFGQKSPALALLRTTTPVYVLPVLVALTLIELAAGGRPAWIRPSRSDPAVLGALILFVPTGILFALSNLTTVWLFEERYLLPTLPGLVLFWSWLLHGVQPRIVRYASLAGGIVALIVVVGQLSPVPDYRGEDWRSAVRSIPDSGKILVASGLVETRYLDQLRQPSRWSYLMAPVLAYKPDVTMDRALLLPFGSGSIEQDYIAQLIDGPLRDAPLVTVIADGPFWIPRIARQLQASGLQPFPDTAFGFVHVQVYQRRP